jgi:uncharacterized protein
LAWADLFAGLAFYLIFEGLFPFASPQRWRSSLAMLAGLGDAQVRVFGLAVVIVGLVILVGVRG